MKSENGILEVYHAGTEKVEAPNCEVGRITLDFGKGFYLTDIYDQALNSAGAKAMDRKSRGNNQCLSFE